MTFTLKLALALLLALCSAVASADPPARAGRLNYLHGTVSLAPGQAPDAWSVAVLNRPLASGDRLWTDRDGYAEFHVGSTAARLAPRTNVDVLLLDDDTLQLRLAQGDVNLRVREVANDELEISTPNGAVLLEQAGSYRISTDASGDTTSIIVHSGRAQVLAPYGSLTLRSGQQVALRGPDGVPSEIVAARMDPFDNWSAELDRREDQVAATRYVSSHMTGYEDLDAHGNWRTLPEYGAVWVPRVSAGWAPYRHGHWVWIEPWGWTWVDDAPWGFAPFHYGRWIWLNGYWAWAPGPRVIRPVYAPALVAFVGGSNWSVSIGSGPAVGWFPLGWREPYFPWYRTSPNYVRNVNVTHVQNITVYNDVTRINYRHRTLPQAVTVVPREAFVSARPVPRHLLQLPSGEMTRAPLVVKSAPAEPIQNSFAARRAETRPPEATARREVFATRTPRPVSQGAPESGTVQREAQRPAAEPRVRVIERQRANDDGEPRRRAQGSGDSAARGTTPGAATPPQAESRPQGAASPARPGEQRPGAERVAPRGSDEPRNQAAPGVRNEDRLGAATSPREAGPRETPRGESAPRSQQPERADAQRERGTASPPKPARPQVAPERPSPEQQAERRGEREAQRERGAPRGEAQRERRPAVQENRPQRPEPRSETQAAPRAEPARPPRPEPRAESQRAPRAEAPATPRAEPPRPSRPQAQAAPQQSQPRAQQPPRPEARGPQNAPSPRAGGAPAREKRDRNGRD